MPLGIAIGEAKPAKTTASTASRFSIGVTSHEGLVMMSDENTVALDGYGPRDRFDHPAGAGLATASAIKRRPGDGWC